MSEFKVILVDPKQELCDEFRKHFRELPRVDFVVGIFEELPEYDCMVSAANSFGLMDGGVDLAISNFFGWDLQERVQDRIIAEFRGEQPVGTSILVPTYHPDHPFIAHTPTMRVPMPITRTDNVYLAMGAWLRAVQGYNVTSGQPIRSVACPGLGTTTGRMRFSEAARQMALAYRNFLNPPDVISWEYATGRQYQIKKGGDLGFKKEST
jgi:O-acetyl-ADP-ribose deacetylase (regulator of RNase III)